MSVKFLGKQLDFDDVLIAPKRSFQLSRRDVQVERDFQFYHSKRIWKGCPIMCSPMPYLATGAMSKAMEEEHMITCLHKFIDKEELHKLVFRHRTGKMNHYTWITTGITDSDLQKTEDIIDKLMSDNGGGIAPNLCIDAANGYSDFMVSQCAKAREKWPDSIIMAGNVCSGAMSEELIMYGGVDIIKVGIGPSKLCATRRVVGVGRPQLSAVLECADAVHGLNNGDKKLGLICNDGGIKEIGDISKAIVAGADFVMCASIFNGVNECDGEWKFENISQDLDEFAEWGTQKKSKLKVYGLSSYEAQDKHFGGSKDYRASEGESYWVDYQGPVKNIIKEIKGSLRSCGTYINAPTIKNFSKCGSFYEVNRLK